MPSHPLKKDRHRPVPRILGPSLHRGLNQHEHDDPAAPLPPQLCTPLSYRVVESWLLQNNERVIRYLALLENKWVAQRIEHGWSYLGTRSMDPHMPMQGCPQLASERSTPY